MKLVMWLMASWEKPYKKDTAGRCAWNFHWNNNKKHFMIWIDTNFGRRWNFELLPCLCLGELAVWGTQLSASPIFISQFLMVITILITDNDGEMTMPIITWWARRRSWCEWREQRWVATRKSQHCRLCGRCQTSEGGCQVHVSREKHTKKWEKAFSCLFFLNNLSPQSLSSSFTDPFTFVTFTLVDKPSQKLMVVHWKEGNKFQIESKKTLTW